MKYNVPKSLKVILRLLLIFFSLFLLYIISGIYLNGMINITYEVVSIEDLKYVVTYSKVFIIYLVLMTSIMIYSLVSYLKKNK